MHQSIGLVVNGLKDHSPHLRLILPAAAALVWTIKRLTGHHEPENLAEEGASEAEILGSIVTLTLAPARRSAAPRLPYKVPSGKSTVLLDILIPTTVPEFWKAIFHSDSDAFERYHGSMGDKDIYVGPWREKVEKPAPGAPGGDQKMQRRRVSFIKPLKNPLGPRQAANQETFRVVDLTSNGFTCECICKTAGVPFSNSFQNELLWVGYQVEDNVMRLIVSGECRFTESVFGMLKNTIARESVNGMKSAYDTFFRKIVQEAFGIIEPEPEEKTRGSSVTKAGMADSAINLVTTNPAVMVALLATIIIIMRMITQQSLYSQLLRKAFA